MNAEPGTGERLLTYRGAVDPHPLGQRDRMNTQFYMAKCDGGVWEL